MISMMI